MNPKNFHGILYYDDLALEIYKCQMGVDSSREKPAAKSFQ